MDVEQKAIHRALLYHLIYNNIYIYTRRAELCSSYGTSRLGTPSPLHHTTRTQAIIHLPANPNPSFISHKKHDKLTNKLTNLPIFIYNCKIIYIIQLYLFYDTLFCEINKKVFQKVQKQKYEMFEFCFCLKMPSL